jgi:glycosyltransferase involved in cell wall biosynthesis
MKWLIVTEDFPPGFVGGIASWAHDLALALHMEGEAATVLARESEGSRDFDGRQPFKVRRMRGRAWGSWRAVWAWAGAWRERPDVAVFSTWELAAWAGRSLHERGAKIMVAVHGSDMTRAGLTADELGRCRAAHWLPVSAYLQSRLLGLLPEARSSVLPMPLRISPAPKMRDMDGPLATIARCTPLKGIEEAADLARRLDRKLIVVGDGPERKRLEESHGGAGVHFMGRMPREEARKELERASGCVLLSKPDREGNHAEGLGLCLLEAAAESVPGIGNATGGIPEALGPGLQIDGYSDSELRERLADPGLGLRSWEWVRSMHGPELCVQRLRQAVDS